MLVTLKRYFSKDTKPKELLHLILVISLVLASIQPLIAITTKSLSPNAVATSIVFVIILICLIVNKYWKESVGFLTYAILAPISNCAVILCIGNNFEPCVNAVGIICFVFMFYKDSPRYRFSLIGFNILLTCAILFYVVTYEPIYGYMDVPYDEIGSFLFAVFWIVLVLLFFNNRNEHLIQMLEEKNEKLLALTNELEYFNYMATHDLKAPIKNTKSFMTLIKSQIKAQRYDKIDEYFDYALEGIDGIQTLTNDIMSLGSVNNSLKKTDKTPVDLNEIVHEVEKLLISSYEHAEVVSDELPVVMGNRIEFFQLFANFIENGVKYNRSKKPRIELRNQSSGSDFKLSFSDNGIGIAKENVDKVFNLFTRLHSEKEFEGTGLGLGLCKKIVNAYNGEIKLDSKLGEGSTFTVHIPEVVQPKSILR